MHQIPKLNENIKRASPVGRGVTTSGTIRIESKNTQQYFFFQIGKWEDNNLLIERPIVADAEITQESALRNKTLKVLIATSVS